jgi:hypothetical protein
VNFGRELAALRCHFGAKRSGERGHLGAKQARCQRIDPGSIIGSGLGGSKLQMRAKRRI